MYMFTPYLFATLTGPDAPTPGTKDHIFKQVLAGKVTDAWRNGKQTFSEQEIEALIADANAAACQNSNLVSLKLSYAKSERWFAEVA